MTVTYRATSTLPTSHGHFTVHAFTSDTGVDHLALTVGPLADLLLLRIHSECATGDVFSSQRCDCRQQLESSLAQIANQGGMVIYMRGHEGRGIGLANKIRAYALQDQGSDTVEANTCLGLPVDSRDYADAAGILRHFNIRQVKLLTNNQDKITALEQAGIGIVERIPLWIGGNPHNEIYLKTKRQKLGHL